MIIDAHAHIFPDKIASKAVEGIGNFYSQLTMHLDGTAETLIREGEAAGISKFLVQSVATTPEQVESINNFISAQVKQYPDKFIGFAAIHPGFKDIDGELERAVSLGLKGLKIHPDFQRFNIDDESAMKIYEAAQRMDLPILVHTGDYRTEFSKPWRMAKVLDRFPELRVIAAHFGGWSEWDDAAKALGGRRIWVDTSSSLYDMTPERARELIDAFGVEHVFFGTDYPMWPAKEELEMFDMIPLTGREREMILHENLENFLGL